MTPVGFELTISAGERPQTYALDRAALGPAPSNNVPKKILTVQSNTAVILFKTLYVSV
jgi:hypothetical protein